MNSVTYQWWVPGARQLWLDERRQVRREERRALASNARRVGETTEDIVCKRFNLSYSGVKAYDAVDKDGNPVEIKTLSEDLYKPHMLRIYKLHKSKDKGVVGGTAKGYFIIRMRGKNGTPDRFFNTQNRPDVHEVLLNGPDSPNVYKDFKIRYYKNNNRVKKPQQGSINPRTQLLLSCEKI
jgi:hypothetical protein